MDKNNNKLFWLLRPLMLIYCMEIDLYNNLYIMHGQKKKKTFIKLLPMSPFRFAQIDVLAAFHWPDQRPT